MKLYVVRHGPAEDTAQSGQDADRALTSGGRDRMARIGRLLLDEGEWPLAIFSSPAVRAVQTAEILATETRLGSRQGSSIVRRELALGSDPRPLVDEALANNARRVMLVGHEPSLSALLRMLLGDQAPTPLRKGAIVGLRLKSPEAPAELRCMVDPKQVILLRTR